MKSLQIGSTSHRLSSSVRLQSAIETLDQLLPCSVSITVIEAKRRWLALMALGVLAVGVSLLIAFFLLSMPMLPAITIALVLGFGTTAGLAWLLSKRQRHPMLPELEDDELMLVFSQQPLSCQLHVSDSLKVVLNSQHQHALTQQMQHSFDNKAFYDGVIDCCEIVAVGLLEPLAGANFAKRSVKVIRR